MNMHDTTDKKLNSNHHKQEDNNPSIIENIKLFFHNMMARFFFVENTQSEVEYEHSDMISKTRCDDFDPKNISKRFGENPEYELGDFFKNSALGKTLTTLDFNPEGSLVKSRELTLDEIKTMQDEIPLVAQQMTGGAGFTTIAFGNKAYVESAQTNTNPVILDNFNAKFTNNTMNDYKFTLVSSQIFKAGFGTFDNTSNQKQGLDRKYFNANDFNDNGNVSSSANDSNSSSDQDYTGISAEDLVLLGLTLSARTNLLNTLTSVPEILDKLDPGVNLDYIKGLSLAEKHDYDRLHGLDKEYDQEYSNINENEYQYDEDLDPVLAEKSGQNNPLNNNDNNSENANSTSLELNPNLGNNTHVDMETDSDGFVHVEAKDYDANREDEHQNELSDVHADPIQNHGLDLSSYIVINREGQEITDHNNNNVNNGAQSPSDQVSPAPVTLIQQQSEHASMRSSASRSVVQEEDYDDGEDSDDDATQPGGSDNDGVSELTDARGGQEAEQPALGHSYYSVLTFSSNSNFSHLDDLDDWDDTGLHPENILSDGHDGIIDHNPMRVQSNANNNNNNNNNYQNGNDDSVKNNATNASGQQNQGVPNPNPNADLDAQALYNSLGSDFSGFF